MTDNTEGGENYTQDYLGGLEYKNEQLEAIYHEEGKISITPEGYQNEYYLKDHLGNIRVVFADKNQDGEIDPTNELLQENHFYPFGMAMDGFTQNYATLGATNRYTYNGKELNVDLGLDMHDYGARWYDASMGRWNSVDPLAEKYYPWSGYNYTLNNPIRFIDPDGRVVYGTDGKELELRKDDEGNYYVHGQANEQTAELFAAMLLTPSGTKAVEGYLSYRAEYRFTVTDDAIFDGATPAHGVTNDLRDSDDSHIQVTISTASIGDENNPDRMDDFTREEKLNTIGTHERGHISTDGSTNGNITDYFEREKQPVMKELISKFEYNELYPNKSTPQENWRTNYEGFFKSKKIVSKAHKKAIKNIKKYKKRRR